MLQSSPFCWLEMPDGSKDAKGGRDRFCERAIATFAADSDKEIRENVEAAPSLLMDAYIDGRCAAPRRAAPRRAVCYCASPCCAMPFPAVPCRGSPVLCRAMLWQSCAVTALFCAMPCRAVLLSADQSSVSMLSRSESFF